MASAIENHLYGEDGTHAMLSISLAGRRVVVAVAPWLHLAEVTEAVFEPAALQHVWADPDTSAEDIAPPWDITGFDSRELGVGRWEFVLHCGVVEFC